MITGIIVALPEERSTLTNKKIKKGNYSFVTPNVVVACSGMGPTNARRAALKLIDIGVTRLISWGCSAALADELKAGDLIIPVEFIEENHYDRNLHFLWQRHAAYVLGDFFPLHVGRLIESSKIISSCHSKLLIKKDCDGDLLDMESTAIAKFAHEKKIPFLAVRAIVDTSRMSLPKAIEFSADMEGKIELRKLLFYITKHPFEIPKLIKLGLHFYAAQRTLRKAAQHLDYIVDFRP